MADQLTTILPSRTDAENIFKKAASFDIEPVIRRYMRKRAVSADRARVVADEMLKYLCLCSLEPEEEWTVTGEVDEMWHMFILFTKRYNEFCAEINGQLIHHVPAEESAKISLASSEIKPMIKLFTSYSTTLEKYKTHFGSAPDSTIWPLPSVFKEQDPENCGRACGCGPIKNGPDPVNGP